MHFCIVSYCTIDGKQSHTTFKLATSLQVSNAFNRITDDRRSGKISRHCSTTKIDRVCYRKVGRLLCRWFLSTDKKYRQNIRQDRWLKSPGVSIYSTISFDDMDINDSPVVKQRIRSQNDRDSQFETKRSGRLAVKMAAPRSIQYSQSVRPSERPSVVMMPSPDLSTAQT